jgi:hypothetical protein
LGADNVDFQSIHILLRVPPGYPMDRMICAQRQPASYKAT